MTTPADEVFAQITEPRDYLITKYLEVLPLTRKRSAPEGIVTFYGPDGKEAGVFHQAGIRIDPDQAQCIIQARTSGRGLEGNHVIVYGVEQARKEIDAQAQRLDEGNPDGLPGGMDDVFYVPDRLITAAECAKIRGIQVSTWHAYVARDQAPKPVKKIGRTSLWDRDQVKATVPQKPHRDGE